MCVFGINVDYKLERSKTRRKPSTAMYTVDVLFAVATELANMTVSHSCIQQTSHDKYIED
jgi:hypothetical protein